MMFSFACLWSSLTHAFALSNDDYIVLAMSYLNLAGSIYGLCNVVDDHCAVRISVIHWCQRLVSLLSGGIPDLELDGGVLV